MRNLWLLPMATLACAAPAASGVPEVRQSEAQRSLPQGTVSSADAWAPVPAPSASTADVSVASTPPADAGPIAILPLDGKACSVLRPSAVDGSDSRACCTPAAHLKVCVVSASTQRNHVPGAYSQRSLEITGGDKDALLLAVPLDRRSYFSMKYPPTVSALLAYKVEDSGITISVRHGACSAQCVGTRSCVGEMKLMASMCDAAGTYSWDGHALVRAAR